MYIYVCIYIIIYIRSNFNRTHPRDATGNNGHRKLTKTLRSNVKTKLDTFGNVVNLFDILFSKSEFCLLNENLNFCPRPNKDNKQNLNKGLLKFYRNIKLRSRFGSIENNSNNLDLKAIAIGYQINYPAVLKPL